MTVGTPVLSTSIRSEGGLMKTVLQDLYSDVVSILYKLLKKNKEEIIPSEFFTPALLWHQNQTKKLQEKNRQPSWRLVQKHLKY